MHFELFTCELNLIQIVELQTYYLDETIPELKIHADSGKELLIADSFVQHIIEVFNLSSFALISIVRTICHSIFSIKLSLKELLAFLQNCATMLI